MTKIRCFLFDFLFHREPSGFPGARSQDRSSSLSRNSRTQVVDASILEHNYNADQSRFLRAVQSVFLQRNKVEVADCYEEPLTSCGLNAVDKLFSESGVEELIGP
jgi:hypothetical protein